METLDGGDGRKGTCPTKTVEMAGVGRRDTSDAGRQMAKNLSYARTLGLQLSADSFYNSMDPINFVNEKSECRLYIGNLDMRISEGALIKMFSPYGKIVAEDFLWHTRGQKRGSPRGFAFIQYSTKEEAELAKEKMNGKLACGRPLVVCLASEKNSAETTEASGKAISVGNKSSIAAVSSSVQMSRSAKIAAIKNKLKVMEEENGGSKKQKQDYDGTVKT